MRDTLIKFWDMGIQSFLIFGDNCRIFFKDMAYFLKKIMGYGILGPPLPGPRQWLCKVSHLFFFQCCRETHKLNLKKSMGREM